MVMPCTLERRILRVVAQRPGCPLDQLMRACPDLQWNQLFGAVDRMSRSGELRLFLEAPGDYRLRLPDASPVASPWAPSHDAVLTP